MNKQNRKFKLNASRNKREGYYAGKSRPFWDTRIKPSHMRWSWFAMNEFYPPIWGSVWNMTWLD